MIRDVLLKYMRTLVKFVLILYLFQFIVDCSESTEPDQEQENTDSFAVVGYWPEWELEQVQITVGEQLTDLLLFSIEPSDDGSLQTDRITFQMIAKSIQIQNTYKTRTMICVGGWDPPWRWMTRKEIHLSRIYMPIVQTMHSVVSILTGNFLQLSRKEMPMLNLLQKPLRFSMHRD